MLLTKRTLRVSYSMALVALMVSLAACGGEEDTVTTETGDDVAATGDTGGYRLRPQRQCSGGRFQHRVSHF